MKTNREMDSWDLLWWPSWRQQNNNIWTNIKFVKIFVIFPVPPEITLDQAEEMVIKSGETATLRCTATTGLYNCIKLQKTIVEGKFINIYF